MVGNEGVEPSHATANQAFERKSFTDFRLEHFPKLESASGNSPDTAGWKPVMYISTPCRHKIGADEAVYGICDGLESEHLQFSCFSLWNQTREKNRRKNSLYGATTNQRFERCLSTLSVSFGNLTGRKCEPYTLL